MALNNPYNMANKLKTDAISSATPEELTLMLYDGALKFANIALIGIEKKDYEKVNNSCQRIRAIIRELQTTLDFKYDIANIFNDYYEFILRRLHTANMKKDEELMKEVAFLLRSIRDTWKEAMKIARIEKAGK
jgi:flagellar protein FliS